MSKDEAGAFFATSPEPAEATDDLTFRQVDGREIEKFEALADVMWDPRGPMRPLHLMNPVRLEFILAQAAAAGWSDGRRPLEGAQALDVGCGAGLLCEPLARLGAAVTGIDAASRMIEAARAHAAEAALAINYRTGTAEDLVISGHRFDIVAALEVVEHVADRHAFVSALGQLVRPGGLVVLSTLSRTLKSMLLAIGAAEYLLGWLPRGTHRWGRFVRPSELAAHLRDAGLRPTALTGVAYQPAYERFRLTRDPSVNYLMAATRDASQS